MGSFKLRWKIKINLRFIDANYSFIINDWLF